MQPPIYSCGYTDQLESIDKDGYVEVPKGPGLGVEYNWPYLEKYKLDGLVIG